VRSTRHGGVSVQSDYHAGQLPPCPHGLGYFALIAVDTLDYRHTELSSEQWQRVADAYLRYRAAIRDAYGEFTQPGMPDGPR